jgi:hypothetical protein
LHPAIAVTGETGHAMNKRLTALLVGGVVACAGTFAWGSNAGFQASYNVPIWPGNSNQGDNGNHGDGNNGDHGDHGDHGNNGDHGNHGHHCGHYPGSAYTVTTVQLQSNQVSQGHTTSATVRSQTQADATPTGFAGLTIQQASGNSAPQHVVQPLTNGKASFTLPSSLKAGSYTVGATYLPSKCSDFGQSHHGGGAGLTVTGQ